MSKELIRSFIIKNGFYPSLKLLRYLEDNERYIECVPIKCELEKIGASLEYECLTTDENIQNVYDDILKSANGHILEVNGDLMCEITIGEYEIMLMENTYNV